MEELEVNHVEDIHEKLTSMIGQRVKVRANMGRTRVVERMGTQDGTSRRVHRRGGRAPRP